MATVLHEKGRSIGLDFARAAAIILVITSHFSRESRNLGFWGVEIFFSLSGFLIGQILWRNYENGTHWTFKHIYNFWSRRWWRTLPNYFLFFIVNILLNYFLLKPIPQFQHLLRFFWFGQNLVNRTRGFFELSWSLCVEEWVYLLFPIALFIYSKLRISKSLAFILTIVTFIIGCSLFRNHLSHTIRYDDIRLITLARLDAIVYGILIAYAFVIIPAGVVKKWIFFFTGVILLATPLAMSAYYQMNLDDVINNQFILLLVPLGSAFMLPVISGITISGTYKITIKCVTNTSLWSYSLYLCHMPILFIVYSIMGDHYKNFLVNLGAKAVGLGIAFVVSALLFKYFELPFTSRRPKELKQTQ